MSDSSAISVPVRPASAGDWHYISKSWMRSYRLDAAHISTPVYDEYQHALIERLWDDASGAVVWLVAHEESDTRAIRGWLCAEGTSAGPVVHYCYVRAAERGKGIASALLGTFLAGQAATFCYTHWTRDGERWARMQLQRPVHNPYLLALVKR